MFQRGNSRRSAILDLERRNSTQTPHFHPQHLQEIITMFGTVFSFIASVDFAIPGEPTHPRL